MLCFCQFLETGFLSLKNPVIYLNQKMPNQKPLTSSTIYWWLIPLSLLWPVLQTLVFVMRFGRFPPSPAELLYFLPMSFLSGLLLLYLWQQAQSRDQQRALLLGYLVAAPFALILSITVGLILPPLLGVTLIGTAVLALGMFLGYRFAKG